MKKHKLADLSKIKTYPARKRPTKVEIAAFAKTSTKNKSFEEFYDSLPHFLAADSLREVVKAIVTAHKKNRPVVIGIGAHVIKVGLNPIIIDLMKRGIVTCVAMNGAGTIHDWEIATLGRTSEDVGAGLEDGTFGMIEETLKEMNSIWKPPRFIGAGFGQLLGEQLNKMGAPYRKFSILATAAELDIPVAVHVAIGTDTIHMSPHCDPAALGQASHDDFRLFCSVIGDLEGGVYLNIGSAVILPEVFLKALTVARNLGNKIKNFTTVNMDMIPHYRPDQNVLKRPGGKGYQLTGHHEIMVPLVYQAVLESF